MAASPFRRKPALLAGLVLAAAAALLGCSGRSVVNPPVSVIDRPWLNRSGQTDPYPDPEVTLAAQLDEVRQGKPSPMQAGRPVKVLVVSGGGKFGAYTAGLLAGWTANGCRPAFDAVTGISSGALIAAYAYLGPKYDGRMAAAFTNLTRQNVFRPRPIRGAIRGDGLTSAEPLADLIARELDPAAMADFRQAHRDGRRLFVATINVTTHRPAVWDLGAIACSGRPDADDLVRKVLLAACSIPVYAPPVPFEVEVNGVRYTELHADAGGVVQAFVRTADGLTAGSDVYVVTAGKVWRDPLDKTTRTLATVGLSVSNALHSIYRAELYRVYAEASAAGARFNLVALPASVDVNPESVRFDKDELRMLFDHGFTTAAGGIPWRHNPPGSAPDEAVVPRTGLQFVTP
ncbi:MAG: patatin-like phospholipase family protein [Gemmataceae bacterium]|nr:patatin-like phospholipase family protein [Gemmataceae bacterium]